MKALFIGGTGLISTACTRLAVERGIDLTILTRRQRPAELPAGVRAIAVDATDLNAVTAAIGSESFDAVADFIAFTPDHVERDLDLFRGRTSQYIFEH